jgi:hypothetical protein
VAPAAPAALTVVGAPPDALAKLPLGSVIDATLQSVDGKVSVSVMTPVAGLLQLKLPAGLQLSPGADLTLQLAIQNGQPALRLLAVNGRPFGAPLPGGMPAGMPPGGMPGGMSNPLLAGAPQHNGGFSPMGTASTGTGQTGTVSTGTAPTGPSMTGLGATGQPGAAATPAGLIATVLRSGPLSTGGAGAPSAFTNPLPGQAPLPAAFVGLTPGTQLTVRLAGIAQPGEKLAASVMPGAAQEATPAPGTSPPVAAPAAGLRSSMPAAIPAEVPGLAAPPPPAASAAAPVLLGGSVLAHSPVGNALVQTPAGLLSLPSGLPLPPGGSVALEVVAPPLPPPPPAPHEQAGPSGPGPAGWPALSDAMDALATADHQAAEQMMRAIPQGGPRLAAGLALFAEAVQSGDFKPLLGDSAVKVLERAGRRDLVGKLKKDLAALADEASRPVGGGGEWRSLTMPFVNGADIDPIRLHVRRPPDDEEQQRGGGQGHERRFILELDMSRLGRLQLDGLVRREDKRFDLILRTAQPLSDEMRRDIIGIFATCGELTGTKGQVVFQAGGRFVELPPTAPPATRIMV